MSLLQTSRYRHVRKWEGRPLNVQRSGRIAGGERKCERVKSNLSEEKKNEQKGKNWSLLICFHLILFIRFLYRRIILRKAVYSSVLATFRF